MSSHRALSRRDLVAVVSLAPAEPAGIFTRAERQVLAALCQQIIPPDEDPGAVEAGVPDYIEKQLAGPLRRFVSRYHEGLSRFPEEFLRMAFETQTAHLKAMESDTFFQLVIDHAMQGYYGHPKHGGNRGRASWKMLKIDQFMDEHTWHGTR